MPFAVVQDQTTLTAQFGNDYILEQVISTFTNAAARDAAIVAPNKGQHVYLESTDQTLRWSGSEWVELLPAKVGGLTQRPTVVCTSTTRPAHAAGRVIYETDTARTYSSDGAAWTYLGGGTAPRIELPMAGGWYQWDGGYMRLGATKIGGVVQINGLVGNNTQYSSGGAVVPAGGIPVGYRPASQVLAAGSVNQNNLIRLDVNTDGSLFSAPSVTVPASGYHAINITYPAA